MLSLKLKALDLFLGLLQLLVCFFASWVLFHTLVTYAGDPVGDFRCPATLDPPLLYPEPTPEPLKVVNPKTGEHCRPGEFNVVTANPIPDPWTVKVFYTEGQRTRVQTVFRVYRGKNETLRDMAQRAFDLTTRPHSPASVEVGKTTYDSETKSNQFEKVASYGLYRTPSPERKTLQQ